ncbi:MAG TPA: hypothetical protein DDX98_03065 [Bacteroidales bacterium]|jgi:glycosyltransferase involved in cell wall biosynthesis|nr:hypothetical protein [Bacteroidales bacterium]
MNILVFTHYSSLYGANRSLIGFIKGTINTNIQFMVVAPKAGELDKELERLNVIIVHQKLFRLYYDDFLGLIKCLPKLLLQRFVNLQIKRKTKKFRPDLIYSNSSVITNGYTLAMKLGIPHLWHIREFRIEDYNLRYFFGEKNLLKKIAKSDQVITISNSIKESIVKGVQSSKIEVIHNGVIFLHEIRNQNRHYPKNRGIVFGILGVIRESKGQLEAIRAIKTLVDCFHTQIYLHIYGDFVESKYRRKVLNYIKTNSLVDNILIKGFNKNIDEIYNNIDVLLVCSKMEGFGRVVVEAMSKGMPVIGKNSGGIPEIIVNGESGLLYDDVSDLFEQMKKLLNDEELYLKLGQTGLETAKRKFTIDVYSTAILNTINRILR